MTDLTELYRPVLYLHSDETYYPITVENYVAQCSLMNIATNTMLIEIGQITPENFLENCQKYGPTNLSFACPDMDWTGVGSEQKTFPGYFLTRNVTDDITEIFYVFLYGYNSPYKILSVLNVGAHQSDWEGIVVRVSKSQGLLGVYYKAHGDADGYWLSGAKCPKVKINGVDRLVFFSAVGSHGSYAQIGDGISCNGEKMWPRILGFANDYTAQGRLLDTVLYSAADNIYVSQPIGWGDGQVSSPYWPFPAGSGMMSNNFFRRVFCFLTCCNPDKYLSNGPYE